LGKSIFDPAQKVHLQLCVHAQHPAVEIIWPGEATGPIDKLTQRHLAGVIYHLCYETNNLKKALACLENAGLRAFCILPPTPALLFNNRPVSFYNIVGMGLVEILEKNMPCMTHQPLPKSDC
jgi:methylmalonyl-CoA/ethylmalonyl-CoA epimerase